MQLIKKIIKSEFIKRLACKLVFFYIKFVIFTSKIKITYHDFDFAEYKHKQSIYPAWHGRVMIMPMLNQSALSSCGIVSDHTDGRLIGGVIEHAGVKIIFGSSNRRRLSSLKEILVNIKQGFNFFITPDGPRGPAKKIKGSLVNIASKTGLPIIPSSCSAKSKKIFNSWDSFMLPLPFNNIALVFGKPIYIPDNVTHEEIENYNEVICNSLNEITDLADSQVRI